MAQIWSRFGWLISFLAGFVTPLLLIALLWLEDVLPVGIGLAATLGSSMLAGLAIGIVAAALLVVGALMRWITLRRGGREFAASLLYCAGLVVALVPGVIVGHAGKHLVARYLAFAGDDVVSAIDRFIDEKRRPPHDLAELVPDYLPAMPRTGSSLYPNYELRSGPDAVRGNPWSLEIEMFEVLKWDVLYYCPKQNCMEMSGGGTIQMGKWVFLDE